MKSFGLAIAICLMSLGSNIIHASLAKESRQDYLKLHNAARAAVGVRPLVWNQSLVENSKNLSQTRLDNCNLIKRISGPYNENIAEASYELTGAEATQLWLKEKPYYNYDDNDCHGRSCYDYINVVMNDTTQLGCYKAQCNKGIWFISCSYYPRGFWPVYPPYTKP